MFVFQYITQQTEKWKDASKLGVGKGGDSVVATRSYSLYYFQLGGKREQLRILFELGKAESLENKVSSGEWRNIKKPILTKRFPLGEIAPAQANGTVIVQSLDIYHFVAKQLNLYGQSSDDAMTSMQVVESLNEMFNEIGIIKFGGCREEEKNSLYENYIKEASTQSSLTYMEELLSNGNNDFFLDNKVSAVDSLFLSAMEFIIGVYPDALTGYPKLTEHLRLVAGNEVIKNYHAKKKHC